MKLDAYLISVSALHRSTDYHNQRMLPKDFLARSVNPHAPLAFYIKWMQDEMIRQGVPVWKLEWESREI